MILIKCEGPSSTLDSILLRYISGNRFITNVEYTQLYASDKRFTCGMLRYYWIDITWLRLIILFNIFLLKKKNQSDLETRQKLYIFCGMFQFLCNYHQLKKTKTKKKCGSLVVTWIVRLDVIYQT